MRERVSLPLCGRLVGSGGYLLSLRLEGRLGDLERRLGDLERRLGDLERLSDHELDDLGLELLVLWALADFASLLCSSFFL